MNSNSSSWSQCFSESLDRGAALANSRFAKCQSRIWRSLGERYTALGRGGEGRGGEGRGGEGRGGEARGGSVERGHSNNGPMG